MPAIPTSATASQITTILDAGYTIEKFGITLRKNFKVDAFPYEVDIKNTPLVGITCNGNFETPENAVECFLEKLEAIKNIYKD